MKIRIRKNDKVKVLAGKDRGKKGKVIGVDRETGRVTVEGANEIKKHRKPQKRGQKGEIITASGPMNSSNVQLICPKCGKVTRIGHKFEGDKKLRVCKKCKANID
ncbi:MAG: 50S ribosomal protein L24 [Candidatus Moranbacteria bacterium]|nr:50S ribosomal protein L24 [Candidatus Moranbacteria bacterium]